MVTGGMAERHPGLRLCFSHGGGAFVGMVPRLSRAWHLNKPARDSLPRDPLEYAKRFWYDSIMFDPGLIDLVASRFGATQVVAGSDYPFTLGDPDPVKTLGATTADAHARQGFFRDNALRFLGRA
jgi:aminocarboxymuconate-semialdehyde decarboxylase